MAALLKKANFGKHHIHTFINYILPLTNPGFAFDSMLPFYIFLMFELFLFTNHSIIFLYFRCKCKATLQLRSNDYHGHSKQSRWQVETCKNLRLYHRKVSILPPIENQKRLAKFHQTQSQSQRLFFQMSRRGWTRTKRQLVDNRYLYISFFLSYSYTPKDLPWVNSAKTACRI